MWNAVGNAKGVKLIEDFIEERICTRVTKSKSNSSQLMRLGTDSVAKHFNLDWCGYTAHGCNLISSSF